jgi:hypothetical protein
MGWFVFVCVVLYLIGIRIVARRYFRLRHGLSAESGEQGVLAAGLVGLIWPITAFIPAVRQPEFCGHHRHVLRREQLRAELERVVELRRREA